MPFAEKAEKVAKQVLGLVARNTPLSDEEWLLLLEARRGLIKPYLDSFPLPTLGDTKCLKQSRTRYNKPFKVLGREVRVLDGSMSGHTQGFFHYFYDEQREREEATKAYHSSKAVEGTKTIWGITRDGHWVLATVRYFTQPEGGDVADEPIGVTIQWSNPKAIAEQTNIPLAAIHWALGKNIEQIAERREKLAQEAEELAGEVQFEEMVLDALPGGYPARNYRSDE